MSASSHQSGLISDPVKRYETDTDFLKLVSKRREQLKKQPSCKSSSGLSGLASRIMRTSAKEFKGLIIPQVKKPKPSVQDSPLLTSPMRYPIGPLSRDSYSWKPELAPESENEAKSIRLDLTRKFSMEMKLGSDKDQSPLKMSSQALTPQHPAQAIDKKEALKTQQRISDYNL